MTQLSRSRALFLPATLALPLLGLGLTACPAKPKADPAGDAASGAEAGGAAAGEDAAGGGATGDGHGDGDAGADSTGDAAPDPTAAAGDFDPAVAELLAAQAEAEKQAREARGHCPEGATPRGHAPPDGFEQWCERSSADGKPSGVRDGIYETFFENGQVHQSIFFKGGKEHGPFITYYEAGKKEEQGAYKFGVPSGAWETWNPEGQPHTIRRYDDAGKLHGEMITFYASGKAHIRATYNHGLLEGPYKSFHTNGELAREGQYTKGRPSGAWTEYDTAGELEATETYENGLPVAHECKQGKDAEAPLEGGGKIEFCEIDGRREGPAYERDAKGRVTAAGMLIDGKKDGIWTEYDAERGHGEVRAMTSYTAGVKDGMYLAYHDDGFTERETGEYIDGKKQGTWTQHHPTGATAASGEYLDDERSGEWTFGTAEGKRTLEVNYWHDEREGLGVFYWPNGNVRARGEYVGGQRRGEWLITSEDGKTTTVEACDPVCEADIDG